MLRLYLCAASSPAHARTCRRLRVVRATVVAVAQSDPPVDTSGDDAVYRYRNIPEEGGFCGQAAFARA